MKNIVGFENLPNAFIKRINIHNSEKAKSYVAMIEMCVKDHKMANGQWSWYDDEILKDNLSILCVLCYNVEIIDDIRNGQLTLSPKDLTNHPSYVSGDVKVKSIPIKIKKFNKEIIRVEFIINDKIDIEKKINIKGQIINNKNLNIS